MCGKLGPSYIEPVRIHTFLTGFVGGCVMQRWSGSGSFIRAPNVNYNVTKAAKMFVVFTFSIKESNLRCRKIATEPRLHVLFPWSTFPPVQTPDLKGGDR